MAHSLVTRPERFYDLFDFRDDYDAKIDKLAKSMGLSREAFDLEFNSGTTQS